MFTKEKHTPESAQILSVQLSEFSEKYTHTHLKKETANHSTPVFLPGESHEQKSLVGYSLRGCESRTRLSD